MNFRNNRLMICRRQEKSRCGWPLMRTVKQRRITYCIVCPKSRI
ncbi:unnamed protein product [Staurois parvus]|uniref:Ribosomal protein L36 n=1 Tax=Staurois parvus TaxID=386267 RepID=A0ABN9FZK5_9NEOB|nr:unnamed protein product [Staurois parvus]